MVDASNPRSWANTSREIAKFKTNLGNSEKLSQNTVEKEGGGFKCFSVIEHSCNIVRPRVQSPTPQVYISKVYNLIFWSASMQ